MLQRILHRILARRHFWRYASFDEVAELYASRLLRVFALRFVTTFTSIFLLNEGYNLVFLCFFWALFYGLKVFMSWPAAKIAAYFGPKHGTLYSNVLAAVGVVFLALVPTWGLPALYIWCAIQGFSSTLYDLCYLIDFSKVKHADHAGKEIGFMNIVEKIATGLSPVVGGVVATIWSPIISMLLSAILFLLSAWPLLLTKEPVRTKQKISFQGFPWRLTRQSLIAETAIGVDFFTTNSAWTLFIALVVFAGEGNSLYAKVGILVSLTLFVSLLSAFVYGKVIDKKGGGALLVASSIANAVTHLFRPTVQGWAGVLANNAANEIATTGYAMAFTRGMFDTADRSGFRITYLFLMEITVNAGAMMGALILGLCCLIAGGPNGFGPFFAIAATLTVLIGFPRFMLYRK